MMPGPLPAVISASVLLLLSCDCEGFVTLFAASVLGEVTALVAVIVVLGLIWVCIGRLCRDAVVGWSDLQRC